MRCLVVPVALDAVACLAVGLLCLVMPRQTWDLFIVAGHNATAAVGLGGASRASDDQLTELALLLSRLLGAFVAASGAGCAAAVISSSREVLRASAAFMAVAWGAAVLVHAQAIDGRAFKARRTPAHPLGRPTSLFCRRVPRPRPVVCPDLRQPGRFASTRTHMHTS